jgi:hypothetical protein
MKKIPLESTIAGSYKFLFGNIISIIGTIWLPVLLFVALLGAYLWQLIPHDWFCGHFPKSISHEDARRYLITHLPIAIMGGMGLVLAALLVRAMNDVGILRHAVGQKTSTTFIWFSLGARVWMMIGVIFIGYVVFLLIRLAAFLIFVPLNIGLAAVANVPDVAVGLTNLALGIVVFCAAVYVLLRLMFFLPAVVVAEHKLSPSRAWELGKGNVWRIAVLLLAVIVPAGVIFGIAFYGTLFATVAVQAIRMHPHGPDQIRQFLVSLLPLLPVLGGMLFIAVIVFKGLLLGAIGSAYKAVTASEEAKS